MTASLRMLSIKTDSKTWESFTRSELKLKSSRVTTLRHLQEKGYQHFWNRNIIRSILPGLRRKRTGLLFSGPKSSFEMKVNLAFYLEIKVPESGGRVERNRKQCEVHSQWWFGLPCHLCFLKSTVNAAIYQEILEHFMLPSADKLYGDADFLIQQDLADHLHATLNWGSNWSKRSPHQVLSRTYFPEDQKFTKNVFYWSYEVF